MIVKVFLSPDKILCVWLVSKHQLSNYLTTSSTSVTMTYPDVRVWLWWDVDQLVEHWTVMPLLQVGFPGAIRDFLPESTFSADSLTYVLTPLCAIRCINIWAHVKDTVVHVRVWWVMETLKHSACTVGQVAWLCGSWLAPGKATRVSHWRNPIRLIQL